MITAIIVAVSCIVVLPVLSVWGGVEIKRCEWERKRKREHERYLRKLPEGCIAPPFEV